MYSSCIEPILRKSTPTMVAHGSVTELSNTTTTIPASQACLIAPFSAVGEEALTTIAS